MSCSYELFLRAVPMSCSYELFLRAVPTSCSYELFPQAISMNYLLCIQNSELRWYCLYHHCTRYTSAVTVLSSHSSQRASKARGLRCSLIVSIQHLRHYSSGCCCFDVLISTDSITSSLILVATYLVFCKTVVGVFLLNAHQLCNMI